VKKRKLKISKSSNGFETFLELSQFSQIAILVDKNTQALCLPWLAGIKTLDNALIIRIPVGEKYKTLESCEHIWKQLSENNFDKKSALIVLGGGCLTDIGGFCSATFKRGISSIFIPTTILSQVDASIGGKNGIDLEFHKNMIGLINEPDYTWINPIFFNTLSKEEIKSGIAEILKHAWISDISLLEDLTWNKDFLQWNWKVILQKAIQAKINIVDQDPYETSIRKYLNFGHTFGHALESFKLKQERPIPHGFAVVAGMIVETFISEEMGMISKENSLWWTQLLISKFGNKENLFMSGTLRVKEEDMDSLFELMQNDKKNNSKNINFSLTAGPGEIVIDCYPEKIIIEKAIRRFIALERSS
jgi:3-dehydroquinate synthase